uniref:Ankyrin repeat domain 33Bb n=1 Tax=Takifugu rubripes TaxID=31033 RepID=A0A3B5KBN0_TAKRU
MKAAVQGRAECVRALMLAGGNIQARDNGRSMTPREWALFTGRYDTANVMLHLISRPCAEQFCDSFSMEWPMLEELVAQARGPKSCWRRLLSLFTCCPYTFYMNNKVNPVDEGVLDHMVRVTTGLCSPFIATACHTVCPGSPPCIGKRRPAVQEILRRRRIAEFFQNSRVLLVPKAQDRKEGRKAQNSVEGGAASAGSWGDRRDVSGVRSEASCWRLWGRTNTSTSPGKIVTKGWDDTGVLGSVPGQKLLNGDRRSSWLPGQQQRRKVQDRKGQKQHQCWGGRHEQEDSGRAGRGATGGTDGDTGGTDGDTGGLMVTQVD